MKKSFIMPEISIHKFEIENILTNSSMGDGTAADNARNELSNSNFYETNEDKIKAILEF